MNEMERMMRDNEEAWRRAGEEVWRDPGLQYRLERMKWEERCADKRTPWIVLALYTGAIFALVMGLWCGFQLISPT